MVSFVLVYNVEDFEIQFIFRHSLAEYPDVRDRQVMHDFIRLYIPAVNPDFPCMWVSLLSTSKLGSHLSSFHIPC